MSTFGSQKRITPRDKEKDRGILYSKCPEDFEDFNVDLDYLKKKRIELDRLIEHVGNERFWERGVDKIKELFPTRNYWDRGINKPAPSDYTLI